MTGRLLDVDPDSDHTDPAARRHRPTIDDRPTQLSGTTLALGDHAVLAHLAHHGDLLERIEQRLARRDLARTEFVASLRWGLGVAVVSVRTGVVLVGAIGLVGTLLGLLLLLVYQVWRIS